MREFEHLIMTRFNVRLPWSKIIPDENWLKRRVELFETYCWPSVRNQSNTNFKWVVFFDANSPDFLKEKVKQYSEWENFIPLFLKEYRWSIFRPLIYDMVAGKAEYLLSTRLDNDDAISRDFVEIIQSNFTKQQRQFLNILYGYRYDGRKIYKEKYYNNSFMSMIEKIEVPRSESFLTIYCGHHGKIGSIAPIFNIKSEPEWMIVIHEGNIGNRTRGIRQPVEKAKEQFAINVDWEKAVKNENKLACKGEQLVGCVLYLIRTCIKFFMRPLRKLFTSFIAQKGD